MKSERRGKRINELDEIDREFFRKEMAMRHKRWVPTFKYKKDMNTIDMSESACGTGEERPFDTIRGVQSLFEEHNREVQQTNRGRIIRIPKI